MRVAGFASAVMALAMLATVPIQAAAVTAAGEGSGAMSARGSGAPPLASAPCAGMLLNPDVDTPDPAHPSVPLGWTSYTWPGGNATTEWDASMSHQGSHSLRATVGVHNGGHTSWLTQLALRNATTATQLAGRTVRLSFWLHSQSVDELDPQLRFQALLELSNTTGKGELRTIVARDNPLSAKATQWRQVRMGDFQMPATPELVMGTTAHLVVEVSSGAYAPANVTEATSVNLDTFLCEVLPADDGPIGSATLLGGGDPSSPSLVWAEHASHRVFADAVAPAPSSRTTVLDLTAARGEVVATHIAVQPLPHAQARSCRGAGGHGAGSASNAWLAWTQPAGGAASVRVGLVQAINVSIFTSPHGVTGMVPDPIVPVSSGETVSLPSVAGATSAYYLQVAVPGDAEPGSTISTNVTLSLGDACSSSSSSSSSSGGASSAAIMPAAAFVVRVHVLNVTIPTAPSLNNYGNLWMQKVPAFDPVPPNETFARGQRYYQSLWSHRVFSGPDLAPGEYPVITIEPNGTVVVNATCYEQHVAYIVAHSPYPQQAIKLSELITVGHANASSHEWPDTASWRGIKIFTDTDNLVFNTSFVHAFTQALKGMMAVLDRHGCADRALLKFYDEPTMDTKTVNAVTSVAHLVKSIDPRVEIRTSGGFPTDAFASVIDVYDIHGDQLAVYKEYAVEAQAAHGTRISVYHNSVDVPDQPPLRLRTFFWALAQMSAAAANLTYILDPVGAAASPPLVISGALCWWAVNDWLANPWGGTPTTATGYYDWSGVLIYPPRSPGAPPVSSLRWEQTLLGMQDYERIVALQALVVRGHAIARPPPALKAALQEAASALSDATAVAPVLPHVRPPNDQPYTVDVRVLDAATASAAASIEALGPLVP